MDEDRERRTRRLAGLAGGAVLLALVVASFLVARWSGTEVDLREGLRLVESAEPRERLLGLAKLHGDARAAPAFARLLSDPDAQVRVTAALMLAGVAGVAGSLEDADADFVERMRLWWEREGRARFGGG